MKMLLMISFVFLILELVIPRRKKQKLLRSDLLLDVIHFIFNGYLFNILFLSWLLNLSSQQVDVFLTAVFGAQVLKIKLLAGLPWWWQFGLFFVIIDFIKWNIHRLLHHVPFFWAFHRVHHSTTQMDFWCNMRFHFMEIIFYKSICYLPALMLGVEPTVVGFAGLVELAIGHWNHSNLALSPFKLKYLINHPEMHIWHHHNTSDAPLNINFGISISLWDWVFATAHLPDHPPASIGLSEADSLPESYPSHILEPFRHSIKPINR